MGKASVEIQHLFVGNDEAAWVAALWRKWDDARQNKIQEWVELRNYLFATDTTTTTNSSLPWKNSTTLPKLTQIRDNLHSNYVSALFPNENWLKWQASSQEDAEKKKAEMIEAYILNKTDNLNFQLEMEKCINDYIDYGNCFGSVAFEHRTRPDPETGIESVEYIGPRFYRISPLDIVFNPMADSFEESGKVVRSVKTIGDLYDLAESNPTYQDVAKVVDRRRKIINGSYSREEFNKAVGFSVDGFGDMYEYFCGEFVELLEYFGDYFDKETGKYHRNMHIVVADRVDVIMSDASQTWLREAPLYHAGWRKRPDNLWAMGPLDNLVGMQYRIDHLENLKADAQDLCVHPPLKVVGDVAAFTWGPGEIIATSEEGDVQEMGKNLQGIVSANNEIAMLENRMELFAGAPREAMGVRSPGEKTMYEVQQLQNASGRIFQIKTQAFERDFLEPLLNAMLETAMRNFDGSDIVRTVDSELGIEVFQTITKDDLVANGKLRPRGARHHATHALLVQNINNVVNSRVGEIIQPHVSSLSLAYAMEDLLGFNKYELVRPNAGVEEALETQDAMERMQEEQTITREQGEPFGV